MLLSKFFVGVCFAGQFALSFASPSPVGSWTQHIQLTASSQATADEKAKIAETLKGMEKMHVVMILKSDHTLVANSTGGPTPGHKGGKWSQKGNVVSIVLNSRTLGFTMAPSGKTMTFAVPMSPQFHGSARVVFTR